MPIKGATGEVRPEDQPAATNSAFSGTFGNCGGGIERFFPKILLKSGAYEWVVGQDMWRKESAGARTPDGDSHGDGEVAEKTGFSPDLPHRIASQTAE
jgi:hypothetical protein